MNLSSQKIYEFRQHPHTTGFGNFSVVHSEKGMPIFRLKNDATVIEKNYDATVKPIKIREAT